ncbi:PAS domain S-box-containing protein/diguanylate cyclase (GGDEF) domain-containing protein [Kushneria avicenniae]|uniref:PAS domain S-box-containing protein/diguanylate cyclase (GGDEF) domain-containing protein n=1 Tax=Kushneria avicenniae TaxID=402385 RepID=A0A1I1KKF0_9GAMM|nr:GGDEF and EAL domain-containing protein [Kushneria avicenniae]SFC59148.1 PAS domain S-box-containing protein/diguanylate cyclase (GGDEF) domain-containing protein [Kushneria avicenniae]
MRISHRSPRYGSALGMALILALAIMAFMSAHHLIVLFLSVALVMVLLAWHRCRQRNRQLYRRLHHPANHLGSHERLRYDRSEQRFRALLESLPRVAVQGYDRQRRVIYWNAASTQLYGYMPGEVMGCRFEELIIPKDMRESVVRAHQAWINEGVEIPASEIELLHKSGRHVAVFSHHVMLGQHTDNPLMFCVDVDLSVQKQAHRDLEFIQRYDPLTLLPNRDAFIAELDRLLEDRQSAPLAVFFIDIEKFSDINDTLGYEQGNHLLTLVAERLSQYCYTSDLLARFGNDEFVMACTQLDSRRHALQLIDRINSMFEMPFTLAGKPHRIRISQGISLFPDNGEDARSLVHAANVARNRARTPGESRFQIFSHEFHRDLIHQHELLKRLENAIDQDELALHFQPQISRSGRIESMEALLRWFPAGGGMVSPAEFIPLAERFGLMERLGSWSIDALCTQQAVWKTQGLTGYRVDLNLSGEHLRSTAMLEKLEKAIQRHQLSMRDVGIEITENVLVRADETVKAYLQTLYHRGMKIAIDDFGTGYSSLAYLKQFPVTSLKIDRTFVVDAPDNLQDRAILAGIVFIGHRLGLEVIAEGVETSEQLELVNELNVDLVQGFYYFRSMPAERITPLLETQPLFKGHKGPSSSR